ncbi:hypothetical protein [Mameliella alba]|uniref:hypothetical protein n=1 Tax=Mameliella alba TaxID=561184 RepID=UPI000B52AF3C|nr:hypothetical protein [Mameliella alba]OWV39402.1 hypothetical protein CDZ95_26100 [Mameliella alba]
MLDRMGILQGLFGVFAGPGSAQARASAGDLARRWRRAFHEFPDLRADLIRQAGLLRPQPVTMTEGEPTVAPLDPHRLAYEAGRRDFALQLLAAGGVSIDELNAIVKEDDYE